MESVKFARTPGAKNKANSAGSTGGNQQTQTQLRPAFAKRLQRIGAAIAKVNEDWQSLSHEMGIGAQAMAAGASAG